MLELQCKFLCSEFTTSIGWNSLKFELVDVFYVSQQRRSLRHFLWYYGKFHPSRVRTRSNSSKSSNKKNIRARLQTEIYILQVFLCSVEIDFQFFALLLIVVWWQFIPLFYFIDFSRAVLAAAYKHRKNLHHKIQFNFICFLFALLHPAGVTTCEGLAGVRMN